MLSARAFCTPLDKMKTFNNITIIMFIRKPFYLCSLLFLCCLALGCGGAVQTTQPVEGLVTLGGSPLAGASITFHPQSAEGTAASGLSDSDGKFRIQTVHGTPGSGTTLGEYRVTVSKIESVPTGKTTTESDGTVIEETTERSVTPRVYSSRESTPLVVNITQGKNTVNLELESAPRD